MGAVANRLQVRVQSSTSSHTTQKQSWIKRILSEFQLCSVQSPSVIYEKQEAYKSVIISWVLSAGIIIHMVWRKVVMGGVLFISVQDAVAVAGRLMLSVLICRTVLMSEISGLRETVTCEKFPTTTIQSSISSSAVNQTYTQLPSGMSSQYALTPIKNTTK